ncbi:hypothetical protein [Nocardioides aquiterrae]|uniref:Uncharacterized protein n=1 Tax=Nocardioides aquiterrae TaxID=203799 RepID=A0ABP4EZB6_9ACTN
MASSPLIRRPLRAAAETGLLGAGYLFAGSLIFPPSACESRPTNPYPCLGGALLYVGVGVPLVTLGIAWALRGKGALHSLVGAVLCVVGTLQVQARLGQAWWAHVPDRAEGPLVVALGCLAVWLWAAYAPGRRSET